MATYPVEGSASIGTTEYSLLAETTTGVPTAQTDDVEIVAAIDTTNIVYGTDIFTVTLYQTANSGGSQRSQVVASLALNEGVVRLGPFKLKYGDDLTIKSNANSRTIAYNVQNVLSSGGSSTYVDREDTQLSVELGDTAAYLVFQARDTAGAAVTGKVAGDWTVKFQRAGASSATAMTTPTVTEQDAGDIPGQYKLLLDEGTTTMTDGVLEEIVTYYLTCTGVQPITRHIRLVRPDAAYRRGTLAGAGSNTAILDAGASSTDDIYVGDQILTVSGTGKNQLRTIIDYDGATKTATLNRAWATTPDTTTGFRQYAGELGVSTDEIIDEMNLSRPTTNPGTTYTRAVAVTAFGFYMMTTAGADATGKTCTFQISKDGGAFATVAGSVTEIGNGFYEVDLTGPEMDGLEILIRITATGCRTTVMKIRTQV